MKIENSLCLGIDIGIASNGWAILDLTTESINAAGVRLFAAPETDKEKKPKNQIRREKRGLRRVIRRKAHRMSEIRRLCLKHGLASTQSKDLFHALLKELNAKPEQEIVDDQGITPWRLRADALKRSLSGAELAVILGHIGKHAGFQSNRKGGEKNEVDDNKKALKAMEELSTKLGPYRTFGEALQYDPELSQRQRNRDKVYDRTPKRDWLRTEIAIIFKSQRRFGNALATKELEENYCGIAFWRNPLQDSENLVRYCPFEEGEKRASKFAPSFEKFRLLQALVHMRIDDPERDFDRLTVEEIKTIEDEFGQTQKLTFKKVRKVLELSDRGHFRGLPRNEETEDRDVAARKAKGAQGTQRLRVTLERYERLPVSQLDEAMAKITFRETNESVEKGLKEIGLSDDIILSLMTAVKNGDFNFAKDAAHISAKACRKIIPGLRARHVYSQACEDAGYDHTVPDASSFVHLRKDLHGASLTEKRKAIVAVLADKDKSPIMSPVARKAAIETVKQFVTLCHEHPALSGGLPGQVNIELAREVGKSPKERSKITKGLERRNKDLNERKKQFKETLGWEPRKGELRVYELALEQRYQCLYSGDAIDPKRLFDGSYQVDHILPWSRFGDNSYINLTLCTVWANQNKKNRTPREWMVEEKLDWESYVARVESCPGPGSPCGMKGIKKRNYLLRDAKEKEEGFRNRNLNDTKWAAKVTLQAIEALYPIELNERGNPIRRVRARPGEITSLLRRGWGLEDLKKDKDGDRKPDDRHHALDAIVVAATSEGMLNQLTRAVQRAEELGKARHFEHLDPPWVDFRRQARSAFEATFCSRAERRRARGEGHEATIRGFDPQTEQVFIRETPEKLVAGLVKKSAGDSEELQALLKERFERPERSKEVIKSIADWALNGAPKEDPPLGPTGDPIRRLRVIDKRTKPAIFLDEKSTVDRGEMVRVDVFSQKNKKGQERYYLVPIYRHQAMNKRDFPSPPNMAIDAAKPEHEWTPITADHLFKFSLYSHCWIEVIKSNGDEIKGYYCGTHRGNGSISVSPHQSLQQELVKTVGARTLRSFKKFSLDRLGGCHEIKVERRTWHGEVYTSAIRLD